MGAGRMSFGSGVGGRMKNPNVLMVLRPGESVVLNDGTVVEANEGGVKVLWVSGLVGRLFARKDSDGNYLLSRYPAGCLAIWEEECLKG